MAHAANCDKISAVMADQASLHPIALLDGRVKMESGGGRERERGRTWQTSMRVSVERLQALFLRHTGREVQAASSGVRWQET